jgi:hypothetical protein
MNTAVFVVVLVAGILAAQLMVWIPIHLWFRRRSRAVAARLASEMESELVIRPPERASYRGATAPGYPIVKNDGVIALTRRRLLFQTFTGKVVEVPVTEIDGVREAKVFKTAVTAGRQHLLIHTPSGEVGFYVRDNAAWIASLTTLGTRPTAVSESTAGVSGESSREAPGGARAQRGPWAILAVVFTSIGLVLAVAAGITAGVVAGSISGDRHADGTVVELLGSGRYRAVVEFPTPDGAKVRFTSSVSTYPPPAEVGGHVGVRYNPDNPQDAVIDEYWQTWGLPTVLGILGTPFLLIGIGFGGVMLAARRRSPT